MKINLNTSVKAHLILGLVIGIWLVIFLIFIAPFDAITVPINIRLVLMPVYGVIYFVCYAIVVFIQNYLFRRLGDWNIWLEIGLSLFFYVFILFCNYVYYKSSIVNGDFTFWQFSTGIYMPILLILSGLIVFGRWYLNRMNQKEIIIAQAEKITLRGSNKTDILQLDPQNLVCISSAQNYVEVHFLNDDKLQKKLLRTTLKKIGAQVPDLVQVHRSHFINPTHFIKWSGSNSITVSNLEIPVSKNYKDQLDLLN